MPSFFDKLDHRTLPGPGKLLSDRPADLHSSTSNLATPDSAADPGPSPLDRDPEFSRAEGEVIREYFDFPNSLDPDPDPESVQIKFPIQVQPALSGTASPVSLSLHTADDDLDYSYFHCCDKNPLLARLIWEELTSPIKSAWQRHLWLRLLGKIIFGAAIICSLWMLVCLLQFWNGGVAL